MEVPFDWELVDGVITPRGETALWHNRVRGGLVSVLCAAETEPYTAVSSQCVMVDERNVLKPDLIVFDLRGLNVFDVECVPVERLALVVEVVFPTSRQADRVRKPALLATSKVPCYWRVELERERRLAVHGFWGRGPQ